MGIINFNGVSSEDLGLIVQFTPTYQYPEREYEKVHIPGKNGELLLDSGYFKNVERKYSLAKIYKRGQGFVASANAIASWLHSANGYARLEDSYEPEYYREAMYKSEGEMTNYQDTVTVLEVKFECKPQRWLISGEKEIAIGNDYDITNPTSFDASPIIKFTTVPNQSTTINIGDYQMVLESFNVAKNIVIDCLQMECYSLNESYNSKLILNSDSFPKLKGKSTTNIKITNATNISLIPRWWTL